MLTPILSFFRRGSASELRFSNPLPSRATNTYPDRKYGLVTPVMSRPAGASSAISQ